MDRYMLLAALLIPLAAPVFGQQIAGIADFGTRIEAFDQSAVVANQDKYEKFRVEWNTKALDYAGELSLMKNWRAPDQDYQAAISSLVNEMLKTYSKGDLGELAAGAYVYSMEMNSVTGTDRLYCIWPFCPCYPTPPRGN